MSDAVAHGPPGLMDTARLRQLAWFRTLSLVLQTLSLPVAAVFLEASLPLRPVLALLALNLGLLVGLWVRTRREQAGRDGEVFAHLLADQTALVALVALTGGASNPLVMLLLLPLALAAVLLSLPRVLVLLALAILGYFLLLSWPDTGAAGEAYRAHLRGMWPAFVPAALLLASFLYWTASALRYREAALSALEEACFQQTGVDLRPGTGSGLDLLESLQERQPALIGVIVTAYASIAVAVEATRRGARDYRAKPVGVTEVVAALEGDNGPAEIPDEPLWLA